jgi:hypothetical protein
MMIIGCDFHPSFQQIAYVEEETGEYQERRLSHRGEAEAFYRSLAGGASDEAERGNVLKGRPGDGEGITSSVMRGLKATDEG